MPSEDFNYKKQIVKYINPLVGLWVQQKKTNMKSFKTLFTLVLLASGLFVAESQAQSSNENWPH